MSFTYGSGYSQYNVLPEISLFNSNYGTNVGFGMKIEYVEFDVITIGIGGDYYLPITTHTEVAAIAKNPTIYPTNLNVDIENKMRLANVYFEFRAYFVGDAQDDYGVFGVLEGGALYTEIERKIGEYDTRKYTLEESNEEIQKIWFSSIAIGVGGEKEFDFGYLFGATKIHILSDIDFDNSELFKNSLPFSINLGVRFPFGSY